MRRNFRVVAYAGSSVYLLGYRLKRSEAKAKKKELVELGYPHDILFIEEYTSRDYTVVYSPSYRVEVVIRTKKYEYTEGKNPVRRMVDRGQQIIIARSLTRDQANSIFELTCNVYKSDRVKIERSDKSRVEIHHDCDKSYLSDTELSGKGLNKKTFDNLTFTSQGFAVDKDARFVPGQLDFGRAVLSSSTSIDERVNRSFKMGNRQIKCPIQQYGKLGYGQAYEVTMPILNPYLNLCGVTSLDKETPQAKRERFSQIGKSWDQYVHEYGTKIELTYDQFIALVRSLYYANGFVKVKKYLTKDLFVRNSRDRKLRNALFCFHQNPSRSYERAPIGLVKKVIDIANK